MMMMMVCAVPGLLESNRIPNVVVVDPRFDEYKLLAAGDRQGRLHLHLRSSGGDALRLARRLDVDAWLVAADLDDMSGRDLVALLDRERAGDTKLIAVGFAGDGSHDKAPVDGAVCHPISVDDIELVLGLPPAALAARSAQFTARQHQADGADSATGRFPRTAGPSAAVISPADAS